MKTKKNGNLPIVQAKIIKMASNLKEILIVMKKNNNNKCLFRIIKYYLRGGNRGFGEATETDLDDCPLD